MTSPIRRMRTDCSVSIMACDRLTKPLSVDGAMSTRSRGAFRRAVVSGATLTN